MKAALVLLADRDVQNFARRAVVELSIKDQVGFFASLLPAHVSLKQPFTFESLEQLDRYTAGLAARIAPFEIRLDRFYTAEWTGHGILGLNVVETAQLRELHDLLNRELAALVRDPSAAHDGGAYHFHLTIEMGKVAGENPFRAYYERLADPSVNLSFTARELGVFFYATEEYSAGSFTTYQILPLTGTLSGPYQA